MIFSSVINGFENEDDKPQACTGDKSRIKYDQNFMPHGISRKSKLRPERRWQIIFPLSFSLFYLGNN
jgi:hypothetical protein